MSDKHEWTPSEEQRKRLLRVWTHEGLKRVDMEDQQEAVFETCKAMALRFAAEVVAQETATLAAKVRELKAENAIMARYVKKFPMSRAETAESRVAELERLLATAQREAKMNAIKANVLDRMPLCSDHRDKLRDCPSCARETAERLLAEAEYAIRVAPLHSACYRDRKTGLLTLWGDLPAVRRALGGEHE